MVMVMRRRRRALNLSRSAVTNGDFACFDDHGDLAASIGQLQHPPQSLIVLQHVEIIKRSLAARVGLPGRGGVGSEILAEDNDFLGHSSIKNKRAAAKLQAS